MRRPADGIWERVGEHPLLPLRRRRSGPTRRRQPQLRSTSDEGPLAFDTGGPHGQGKLQIGVLPCTVGPNIISVMVTGAAGIRVDVAELDAQLSMPDKGIGPMTVYSQGRGHGSAKPWRLRRRTSRPDAR
jgi:hypothetical protein